MILNSLQFSHGHFYPDDPNNICFFSKAFISRSKHSGCHPCRTGQRDGAKKWVLCCRRFTEQHPAIGAKSCPDVPGNKGRRWHCWLLEEAEILYMTSTQNTANQVGQRDLRPRMSVFVTQSEDPPSRNHDKLSRPEEHHECVAQGIPSMHKAWVDFQQHKLGKVYTPVITSLGTWKNDRFTAARRGNTHLLS